MTPTQAALSLTITLLAAVLAVVWSEYSRRPKRRYIPRHTVAFLGERAVVAADRYHYSREPAWTRA